MNIIYGGFLDNTDKTFAYTITDMEQSFSNINDARVKLLSFTVGGVNSSQNFTQEDNGFYQSSPNLWMSENLPAKSQVAFNADSGIAIGASDFSGTQANLVPNGNFSVNDWMRLKASSKPALYLHMRNNANDVGLSLTRTDYSNGILFEQNFTDNVCPAKWFYDNDGIIYFVHGASYNIKLGWLVANTTSFNYIGELAPLKLYAIQSFPAVAQGIVRDSANNVTPNKKIAAFKRNDYRLVGTAISKNDGSYSMPLLAAKGESLFFVCLDDDEAPDFEAQIHDRIIVG